MRVFRVRKKAVAIFAACVTGLWYLVTWMTASLACSLIESQRLLDTLCEDYHNGLIDGNICSDICDKQTITFQKCANYRDGKKILFAKREQETIVLKSKKARWTDYDPIEVAGILPTLNDFAKMVRESVEFSLGINHEHSIEYAENDTLLFSKLWSMGSPSFPVRLKSSPDGGQYSVIKEVIERVADRKKSRAMMRSLWTLVQQTEYVTMTFLQDKEHIPSLLGTCGHIYAMEYLPPKGPLESTLLDATGLGEEVPWKDHLKITLSLLEALKSYDEEFHETLHLCDVKGENFGVSASGTVKLVDLDTVFFTSRLRTELSEEVCSKHTDCDFFDCEGWCNTNLGKCKENRINNNLQVICKKLLSTGLSNKYVSLLHGAPYDIEEQLAPLVNECANSAADGISVDPLTQHHAPVRLLDRIYNILQNDLVQNNHS